MIVAWQHAWRISRKCRTVKIWSIRSRSARNPARYSHTSFPRISFGRSSSIEANTLVTTEIKLIPQSVHGVLLKMGTISVPSHCNRVRFSFKMSGRCFYQGCSIRFERNWGSSLRPSALPLVSSRMFNLTSISAGRSIDTSQGFAAVVAGLYHRTPIWTGPWSFQPRALPCCICHNWALHFYCTRF